MKTKGIILGILVFFIFSCSKDNSTGPGGGGTAALIGWCAGGVNQGYGVILYTSDGGNHWTRQGDSTLMSDVIYNSVRAIDSLNAWAVGSATQGYGSIFRTTDGGNSWLRQGNPNTIPNQGLLGMDVINTNTAWVVGSQGTVLLTTDGGNSWDNRSDTVYSQYDFSDILVFGSYIWIVGGTSNSGLIIHSTDEGATWTSQGDTSFTNQYQLITISGIDAGTAWTVGHGSSILFTADSGNTWQDQLPLPHDYLDANGICAIDAHNAWCVMDNDRIFKTTDQGQNWNPQTSPSHGYYLLRICALDQNTAWLAGSELNYPFKGLIMHTTDGGQNWIIQDSLSSILWDVSFVNSYH